MSELWHWFLIGLIAAGVGTVVISFVFLLYIVALYWHTKGLFTDKLTGAGQIIGELARYPFRSLLL